MTIPAMSQSARDINVLLNAEAKPHISFYKRRRDDPTYFPRVQDCIDSLSSAETALHKAVSALNDILTPPLVPGTGKPSRPSIPLDREHEHELDELLGTYNTSVKGLLKNLQTNAYIASDAAAWFADRTGQQPPKVMRGRPALKSLLAETRTFMQIWEKITGTAPVTPKAKVSNGISVAGDRSTQFVLDCLKQVDPRVTLSQTITSIRKLKHSEWPVD